MASLVFEIQNKSKSEIVSNCCVPCCTSCLLILAECRRLVRVSKGLRCIIVSTERDIVFGSDVVQDNTGKGWVGLSVVLLSAS